VTGSWRPTTLGQVACVKHGFAFAGEHFSDAPTRDILLTPGNFSIGGGFKLDRPKFYDGPVPAPFVLRPGSLVVTMTDLSKTADTLGFGALVPESHHHRFLHNQRVGLVELRNGAPATLDFIYWITRSAGYRQSVVSSASGSTVKHTAPSRIESYSFLLPPLPEQRAIARILGALDDKIELNRRTNETLEAMARALFQSWFVDFDPVRAKMEGRQPDGMDAETAKLFPSKLTAYGSPLGWIRTSLGDLVTLQRGTTYKGALVGQPGPALLGLGSIVEGGGFREERYKTYGGECPDKLMLFPGDLFVALKGATKDGSMVGSVARVPRSVRSGRLTQDTVKLVLNQPQSGLAQWIYRALLTPDYRAYCGNRVTGSAQAALSREDFLAYSLPLPVAPILVRFGDLESDWSQHRDALLMESRTLTTLRDALLPKLLSGELRVPEAERLASEVL
jgi:type I restriction enzyme S subunit